MTPLPGALGGRELLLFRLDLARHAAFWDSGEGARLVGGRWNSRGRPTVYCAFDASTAVLEVAVHKTFANLDVQHHVLSCGRVLEPARVHVVQPADVPNPNWLRPGMPSAGQQRFGDALLEAHPFVALPSAVSPSSWNLLINPLLARGEYALLAQERFALDTRLNPVPT